MKKVLSIIPLLFVMMFIVTSCDNEHQHSYAMKSNETMHWKECKCGEKSEEGSHSFGNWTTTKESTVSTTGTKERECSVCHYKETDTIPVLKHDTHSYTTTKFNETKHWKECECGEKSEEESHTFGAWTTTTEATSTTTGLRERECSVCHYKETENIPVNSHTHSYTTTKFNETKHWKECSCGEKSEEENHTFGNWETVKEASYTEPGQKKRVCSICEYAETEDIPVKEITDIATFLEENNDIIVENLETQYQSVLKTTFGRAYGTDRFNVLNYRWDLGEVVNAKVQNLKMTFTYHDNNASTNNTLRVYDVMLNEAIEIKTLLDATAMASIKTTNTTAYTYTYDATNQHDRDELIEAILKVAVTDGFKYEMKDVIYTENTQSTDSELGTIRRFTIVISNEKGIREIYVSIKNTDTDKALIEYIATGKYKAGFIDKVVFSSNQLKEVDLTAPTDPNTIEYLIYYHNDEITANLETQYQSVLKTTFGRAYGTDRFNVLNYRWDLGEIVNGKVQNLKMTFTYHDNNASTNNTLRVYDVMLNEAIEIKTLLDATAMASIKTTNTTAYTYTYDATNQHDMNEVLNKVAELELNGFVYDSVYYWRVGTSPNFGGSTIYTLSYIGENGIKEVTVVIKAASTTAELLTNINNGYYRLDELIEVGFSNNQLKEVDLTVE